MTAVLLFDVFADLLEAIAEGSPGRWRKRGACRGKPLAMFFPVKGELAAPAKLVCSRCPVRDACRDHAASLSDTKGVWGGLSDSDRTKMARAAGGSARSRSERRAQVQALRAEGLTLNEIADTLSISYGTVRNDLAEVAK